MTQTPPVRWRLCTNWNAIPAEIINNTQNMKQKALLFVIVCLCYPVIVLHEKFKNGMHWAAAWACDYGCDFCSSPALLVEFRSIFWGIGSQRGLHEQKIEVYMHIEYWPRNTIFLLGGSWELRGPSLNNSKCVRHFLLCRRTKKAKARDSLSGPHAFFAPLFFIDILDSRVSQGTKIPKYSGF